VAGAIDRTSGFNIGRKKLPADDDEMRDQLDKLCRYCGFFLYSGYRRKPGYNSKTWKKQFEIYKQKKPKLDLY